MVEPAEEPVRIENPPVIENPPAYLIGKLPFIMISYAFQDREIVYAELRRLHALGYRFWYDEGTFKGGGWLQHVERALENSSCVLVFLSNHALTRPNVMNEIEYARMHMQLEPLLAVCIEEITFPEGEKLRFSRYRLIHKYGRPDLEYYKEIESAIPQKFKRSPLDDEPKISSLQTNKLQLDFNNFRDLLSSAQSVIPLYNETNAIAGQFQKKTKILRLLVYVSCWFVVLLAILQIFYPSLATEWSLVIEIFLIVFASVVISVGIASKAYNRWLLERIRAERFQFLRFRQLIDPLPQREFNLALTTIREMNMERLVDWLYGVVAPYEIPKYTSIRNPAMTPRMACELLQHYCENRIRDELHKTPNTYAGSLNVKEKIFWLPTIAFFSFIIILFPLILDLLPMTSREDARVLGITYIGYCIVFTLLYAIIWVTIRGLWGDKERNKQVQSTLKDNRQFLLNVQTVLVHQKNILCSWDQTRQGDSLTEENEAIAQVVQAIYRCEGILENNLRFWLRTKFEKRWFG